MHAIIESHRPQFDAVIEAAKGELGQVRTGRANPLLVEQVMVEAYGTRTPLRQVASITVPEASSLMIEPWDKSILKDVERGLVAARLGLTPSVAGQSIRLSVPPLTTETRAELARLVNAKIEQLKTRLRGIRDKVREGITKAEKAKSMTQDDRYEALAQLDDMAQEYGEKLKAMAEKKVQEINTF